MDDCDTPEISNTEILVALRSHNYNEVNKDGDEDPDTLLATIMIR